MIAFEPLAEFGVAQADGEQTTAQGFNLRLSSGNATSLFIAGLEGTGVYASNGSKSLYAANDADIVLTAGVGGIFNLFRLNSVAATWPSWTRVRPGTSNPGPHSLT